MSAYSVGVMSVEKLTRERSALTSEASRAGRCTISGMRSTSGKTVKP
jgi:hypothetical protein